MADIIKLDLTNVQDYIQGAIQLNFFLTTYADGATINLASGRVEEVGGFFYRVESGDLAITDSGVANGIVYVLLLDDGDGTASAYLTDKTPSSFIWDPNKGGYYVNDSSADDGAKVIFAMTKAAGPVYSNRGRLLSPLDQSRAIGEIFGIHPNTSVLPNPFNFSPCDGVELLDSNFISTGSDTYVPNITDDRFLMGDTIYGRVDVAGRHVHQAMYWNNSIGSLSALDVIDETIFSYTTISHPGDVDIMTASGDFERAGTGDDYLKQDNLTAGQSQQYTGGPVTGAGNDPNIRPHYFSVFFYIRIR